MASVNFNLRSWKVKNHPTPIHAVIRWNGERIVIDTLERVEPRYWTKGKYRQFVSKSCINHDAINKRLERCAAKIKNAHTSFLNANDDEQPTKAEMKVQSLIALGRQKAAGRLDFIEFIERFIEGSITRINPATGKTFAKKTTQNYNSTLKRLKEFEEQKKYVLSWKSVNQKFYDKFVSFLRVDLGQQTNTIGKHIQQVKTFINAAMEEGYDTSTDHRKKAFKALKERTPQVYLTADEIEEVFSLNLTENLKLDRVRDLFIIGAWTGLRFSDFINLQPSDINRDDMRINVKTQKTGVRVKIPMHPFVLTILEKYTTDGALSLPTPISNQKMNKYIKEVVALVPELVSNGKAKKTTTHTCRRSFATNIYKAGAPSRSIMAITGHKTEQAFREYIRADADDHADIIASFMPVPALRIAN